MNNQRAIALPLLTLKKTEAYAKDEADKNKVKLIQEFEEQTKKGVSRGSSSTIVIEKKDGLTVVGARNGKEFRKVPFMSNQGKRPEYSITQDGQWWIMGDDRGIVQIGNLITGKEYTLTEDGRPAHTGPVVGVVTSETNPQLGFPEYAVTIGEENRLKVWDLLSRLKPKSGKVPVKAVSSVSKN